MWDTVPDEIIGGEVSYTAGGIVKAILQYLLRGAE